MADAIFTLRQTMEHYRDDQRDLHCIYRLGKAYDRVPRQELYNCVQLERVDEKYVYI